MNLLEALLSHGRVFTGRGTNHERERFVGRLEIQPLVNESALMLHYTATGIEGEHFHKEATLLGTNEEDELCLWPVMEELPFVLPHPQVSSTLHKDGELVSVFASGPRDMKEVFREEITFELKPNGELTYAHSWGMPGGTFEARSSCVLFPAEA